MAAHPQITLEAEKIIGTCHFAIGDNHTFNGNVISDIHVDFIIPEPITKIDDVEIELSTKDQK